MAAATATAASGAAGGSAALSDRATGWLREEYGLMEGMRRVMANPFDWETRRHGCINLGVAENDLMFDELRDKWKTVVGSELEPERSDFRYGDFTGVQRFKQSLVAFLNRRLAIPQVDGMRLEPSDMAVFNGCGSAVESLFHVLCDPGDIVLIPSPYYGGFDMDLERRARVQIRPIPLHSADGYLLTADKCRLALQAVTDELMLMKLTLNSRRPRVRAVLAMNPVNPLGTVYTTETVLELAKFCADNDLQLVMDEIYAFSIFDRSAPFTSVLALMQQVPDLQSVHWLWGFSKDFCMNGFRAGVLASKNKDVMRAVNEISYFTGTPMLVQRFLGRMLQQADNSTDTPWSDWFIALNESRLLHARDFVLDRISNFNLECKQLPGQPAIRFLPATAGFFLWIDLSAFINGSAKTTTTMADEDLHIEELKVRERDLFIRLIEEGGVYIAPGAMAFHSQEPGWFRVIFAQPDHILSLAMERIFKVLRSLKQ